MPVLPFSDRPNRPRACGPGKGRRDRRVAIAITAWVKGQVQGRGFRVNGTCAASTRARWIVGRVVRDVFRRMGRLACRSAGEFLSDVLPADAGGHESTDVRPNTDRPDDQ